MDAKNYNIIVNCDATSIILPIFKKNYSKVPKNKGTHQIIRLGY
jgi:hypothetical protein